MQPHPHRPPPPSLQCQPLLQRKAPSATSLTSVKLVQGLMRSRGKDLLGDSEVSSDGGTSMGVSSRKLLQRT